MKKTSLLLLCTLITLFSQAQTFQWAKEMIGGSSNNLIPESICTDKWGNSYITGQFQDSLVLDNTILYANNLINAFVAKYNSTGNLLWAMSIGDTNTATGIGIHLTSDHLQFVLIGNFFGTVDFDPGPAVTNQNCVTGTSGFIARYDSSSSLDWVTSFTDTSGYAFQTASNVDENGNIYCLGNYTQTLNFNPKGFTPTYKTPSSSNKFYIAKMGSNGILKWVKDLDGNYIRGNDLTIDSLGYLYHAGYYNSWGEFDPGPGNANLSNTNTFMNSNDAYISKLDSNGNFEWAKSFNGNYNSVVNSISLDLAGNVYSTGKFAGTTDFDPSAGTNTHTTGSGNSNDPFISKLNSNGNYVWAKQVSGEEGYSIEISTNQNIFLHGYYRSYADLDPSVKKFELRTPNTNHYASFVSKYNLNGDFSVGYGFTPSTHDFGGIMTLDSLSNIYVCGIFWDSLDVSPGPSSYFLNGPASRNLYLTKLNNCGGTNSTIDTCFSSALVFNGSYISSSGIYSYLFNDGSFCDSLVSYNILIGQLSATIQHTSTLLNAKPDLKTYQWIRCNPYSLLNGETSNQYNAFMGGDFAVIVKHGNCIDTSSCVTIFPQSIDEFKTNQFPIHPNPATNEISINCNSKISDGIIKLLDPLGKILFKYENFNGKTKVISIENIPAGLYILFIESNGKKYMHKIIKQ